MITALEARKLADEDREVSFILRDIMETIKMNALRHRTYSITYTSQEFAKIPELQDKIVNELLFKGFTVGHRKDNSILIGW